MKTILLSLLTLAGLSAFADQPMVYGQYVPTQIVKGTDHACFLIPVNSSSRFLHIGPALGEAFTMGRGGYTPNGQLFLDKETFSRLGSSVTFHDFRKKYSKSLVDVSADGTEVYILETTSINGRHLRKGMDLSEESVMFETTLTLEDEDTLRVVTKRGRSAADNSFECVLQRVNN